MREKKNVDREAGHVLAHCSSAVPGGLVVRIRRSHRRGRGSIPRLGSMFFFHLTTFSTLHFEEKKDRQIHVIVVHRQLLRIDSGKTVN